MKFDSRRQPEEISFHLDCQSKNSSSIQEYRFKNNSDTFGSSWVQSLQWEDKESEPYERKKKLRNILLGGYSDQIQKLARRETSDIAISEHKSGNERNEFITMIIKAILHSDDIVVAKCSLSDSVLLQEDNSLNSQLKDIFKDFCSSNFASFPETEAQRLITELEFLVLFQKHSFCKQLLKTGKSFLLLNPWHYLKLKFFHKPIILCKYFKNVTKHFPVDDKLQVNGLEEMKRTVQNVQSDKTKLNIPQNFIFNSFKTNEEKIFCHWNKKIDLIARIQRIWNNKNSANDNFTQHETSVIVQQLNRFSLLLQSKDGIFFELIIPCFQGSTYQKWLQCGREIEGKCYLFHNLRLTHKFEQKKYSKLFDYLSVILKQSAVCNIYPEFIYQVVINDTSKLPTEMANADIIPHIPTNFQPLIQLLKNMKPCNRFSCQVKVFFQYNSVLYVIDESLLKSPSTQYTKVFLSKPDSVAVESEIAIKDALVHEGCLFMDRYSQLLIVSNNPRQKNCTMFNGKNIKIPLRYDSERSDLVFIEGNVISVDESNSYTWLECSTCRKENLVQDSRNVIYCEDCSFKAIQPVLKAKMILTTISAAVPNAKMNIQLLSQTTKKMLEIDEKSLQPQCNISDIIGKKVGPLLCYVKGHEIEEKQKVIYLCEIEQP